MTQQPPKDWKLPFFAIWTGQAFSLVGSALVQFALVWWMTKTTGSATVLATGALVAILPGVILGPFAGALVDRWSRRVVMIVADGAIALFSVALVYLYWIGAVQIWHVYVVLALRAIGGTFHWPAMTASTSLMVPKEQLSRVAGLNQALQGAINIAAPPLGAVLLGFLPFHAVIAVDVVTAALAILPLFFVAIPQPGPSAAEAAAGEGARASVWADVRAGLRYVWAWPGLLLLVSLAAVLNFLVNPGFALAPILVTRHFGGGVLEIGWIDSAWGAGFVVGALVLSVWGGFKRRVFTSFAGLIGMGFGIMAVGLAPSSAFWLALAGLAFAGFMNPIVNGPFMAVLQSSVEPGMQGRVFMIVNSVCAAMTPIGLAIAGPVGDSVGPQVWFVIGGIASLLMGVGCFFIPALVNIENNHRAAAAAPATADGAPAAVAAEAADVVY